MCLVVRPCLEPPSYVSSDFVRKRSQVLRAILDQGCDPKEYGQQYEMRLRQAELESIQDYLAESDNLVLLHEQARLRWSVLLQEIEPARA